MPTFTISFIYIYSIHKNNISLKKNFTLKINQCVSPHYINFNKVFKSSNHTQLNININYNLPPKFGLFTLC